MSKNKTDFINFFKTLVLLGLIASAMSCQPVSPKYFNDNQHDEILGGKAVEASSLFAKKVIYLAIGVETKKTKYGTSMRFEKICTAAALTKRVLLTAAHCVAGWNSDQISASSVLNPLQKNTLNPADWIASEKVLVHPYFKTEPDIINDIALIKLSQDLKPDQISKLAVGSQTSDKMKLVLVGYGITNTEETKEESQNDSTLNYVLKPVVQFNPVSQKITVSQLDDTGICSGDSGSPGFIYDAVKKDFVVLGVASYVLKIKNSKDSASSNCHGYGVYMNILTLTDWINKNILVL